MKLVEFLYFYLMPETPVMMGYESGGSGGAVSGLQRSPSKRLGGRSGAGGGAGDDEASTRTTEEKQALLGRYLNNVEDLVEDLRESALFGVSIT